MFLPAASLETGTIHHQRGGGSLEMAVRMREIEEIADYAERICDHSTVRADNIAQMPATTDSDPGPLGAEGRGRPKRHRNRRGSRLRAALFSFCFYGFSAAIALLAALASYARSNRAFLKIMHFWARGIVKLMDWITGITVEVRGRSNIPTDGPCLVAAKHQAFGDGIVMLSELTDLAVVAEGSNLRYPVLGRILSKMDAVLVDTCGGETQRQRVSEGGRLAAKKGKSILIYPEGRLVPVGAPSEYKAGIYFLYADLGLPVLPVATNLGLRWQCRRWRKFGGAAAVEFLEPIQPGLNKESFMAVLEERIESTSQRLVEEQQ